MEENCANISPQGTGFKPIGVIAWLEKKGGAPYLWLDPYTRAGWRSVVKFWKISGDKDSLNYKSLPQRYYDTLYLVQDHWRPGNWTISAKEGLHRLTASLIRTLDCKFDTVRGLFFPDTIDEKHFGDNYVGSAIDMTGPEFQNKIYKTTFNSK